MNNEEQCRSRADSLTSTEPLNSEAVDDVLSRIEDRELYARLCSLAKTQSQDLTEQLPEGAPGDSLDHTVANESGLRAGDWIAGRYRILRFIDRGGMGEVYSARDELLGVEVALKTIHPRIARDPSSLRKFKQEVLLSRSISHSNVCRIFDLGEDEGTGVAFLTMELLHGETLRSRILWSGPLAPELTAAIVRQMVDGIESAHRAGVIHRDFKTGNIMLVPTEDGERVVIMDFGLALEFDPRGASAEALESLSEATGVSEPQGLVGTPAYMAPEQVTNGVLSPATDLYALGVVMFEMLTGSFPFLETSPLQMALAHVVTEAPPLAEHGVSDPLLRSVVARLLRKDPDDRFTTAADLRSFLDGRGLSSVAVPHNLPAERNDFVGRQTALEELSMIFPGDEDGPAAQVLTLFGTGGIGKTRLALRYAWQTLGRWSGGVWFCDLSEAKDLDGLVHGLAAAMDVPVKTGDVAIQKLSYALAARGPCLLVLDNFEHFVEHAEQTLGLWTKAAPEARFIVTSRARLRLPNEVVYEVPPMDVAGDAVQLFASRARDHSPDFAVDDARRTHVEVVVAELEGIPLAIELAAARLRMMSLEDLRERLSTGLSLLRGGQRGRHVTFEAAMDWSWSLLLPVERSSLIQLSVFEGGFTLEAAEVVLDLGVEEGQEEVLDVLQSLLDQSWLRTTVVEGAPRFRFFAAIQNYVETKVTDRGAGDDESELRRQAIERHGSFFARWGEAEGPNDSPKLSSSRDVLVELDNIIAACRRSIEREDGTVGAHTFVAAADLLITRGPVRLAIELGRRAMQLGLGPQARARAARWLGVAEIDAGEMDPAFKNLNTALELSRELGDKRTESDALGSLGNWFLRVGKSEEARRFFDQVLAMARVSGNRFLEASMLTNTGNALCEQGALEKGAASFESALRIYRELGESTAGGPTLHNLGTIHSQFGRITEARECYEEALRIQRELGNRSTEGSVLGTLAILHFEQQDMEAARDLFGQSVKILREVGDRHGEGIGLGNLGNPLRALGRVEEARAAYTAALDIHREVGNRRFEGSVLRNLADLQSEQGHVEEADQRFDEAIAMFREVGDRFELALGLLLRGRHELRKGSKGVARDLADEVESIAEELGLGAESTLIQHLESLRQELADL